MQRISRHLILALIGFLPAAGCSTWQGRTFNPGSAVAISGEHPLRVTRYDGTVLVLHRVLVTADSVFGDFGNPPRRLAISLSEVSRIEERRVSPPHTLGLALVIAAALALGIFATLLYRMISSE